MLKFWRQGIIGGPLLVETYVKYQMYAGLEDRKLRKVPLLILRIDVKDQLLELHTNLTLVQARLLEILHEQLGDAEVREMQQQTVQRHWNQFTVSLEESLDLISVNATKMMTELFTGLLRLQSFTRDSARYVGEELVMLEGDVGNVRGELHRLHEDINGIASKGISKIDDLAERSQQRLSMVCTWVLSADLDTIRS